MVGGHNMRTLGRLNSSMDFGLAIGHSSRIFKYHNRQWYGIIASETSYKTLYYSICPLHQHVY